MQPTLEIQLQLLEELKAAAIADKIEKLVVGAIILQDNKVLVIRRVAGDFMGGLVEFPSGKLEPEEDVVSGLVRETLEETSLNITTIKEYKGSFDYTSGMGKKSRQLNFLVEAEQGTVKVNPKEHNTYFWVHPNDEEFETLNISQNTKTLIKACFRI